MADRIKLTEDDIETFSNDEELLEKFDLSIEIHTKGDEAKSIKHQILEDHDIVSNLGVNPRQLIQEWKTKVDDYEVLKPMYSKLEKKLEKIDEAYNNIKFTDDGEVFQDKIKKILESK